MKPRLLVLTTVHHPDDVRIRRKLIESLRAEWDVTYATRSPGASQEEGMIVRTLDGGRLVRNLRAVAMIMRGQFDVLSLHDPETLPAGLLAAWVRRKTVVFDVHENIPAQIRTKDWLPRWSRRAIAWMAQWVLRLAEKSLEITLAEPGYATLFSDEHPVFENLLPENPLPKADASGEGVVYLGDITPARGVYQLVEAAGLGLPGEKLTLIGSCDPAVESRIRAMAAEGNVEVELTGRLPHEEALAHVSRARVAASPLLDIPNYRWSMPTKLFEYLAVGIPVVASDLPGTRQGAQGREGVVFVPPGDVDELAEALRLAIDDDELQQAARRQAPVIEREQRFPAETVRTFYRSLLD